MPAQKITRGSLTFQRSGRDESNVTCTLGDPDDPESEYVFELHDSFFDDVIAGLTAMKRKHAGSSKA